jgi:hypothetical protein
MLLIQYLQYIMSCSYRCIPSAEEGQIIQMHTKNMFRVSFMAGERKWIGNSFKESYIYINSMGTMSPNGKGIDQHST